MRGFIISLLPALEEEGSEYFDRVSDNNTKHGKDTTDKFKLGCYLIREFIRDCRITIFLFMYVVSDDQQP